MARSAMAWSRVCRAVWALVMLAVGFQPVAGYRLAIVSQPLCGSVAGLRLQRQPSVQVQITDASELVDSQRSWQPGEEVASGLQDEFRGGQVIDVLAQGSVSVAFGVNPVGATFENGANTTTMMMREGVADGRDVTVMGGGTGFTLVFTFTARDGSLLTVESEPFMCLGQSVSLKITRQPRLQLPGAVGEGISIQPEVTVVDSYGQVVPGAGPAVTVSIATNPSGSELSADSMATVRAEHGVAVFEELQLTRAASQVEAQVPAYEDQTTLFALRFSSPGFEDVISEPFEVLPLMAIDVQPYSDKKRVIHAACSGPAEGCVATLRDIVGVEADRDPADGARLEKIQSALLDIRIGCTDLDGAGEMVELLQVGGRTVPTEDYMSGPWEGCAFAGCRLECGQNFRSVSSGLDVKGDLGTIDPVSGVFITSDAPLPVHVALSRKVDICPCNGTVLNIEVTLTITYSIMRLEQGAPLVIQPRILLQNVAAELYTLHAKAVSVEILVNPSHALLTGSTTVLSQNGVAQFTDVAITEAGTGFVLRFSITNAHGNTMVLDSLPFNIGRGNLPIMQLTEQPAASARNIGRALRTPPLIELKRIDGGVQVNTASNIEVSMVVGLNGPDGDIDASTETTLRANPESGEVLFLNVLLLNGNCADCEDPPEGPGKCGLGYTLVFVCNDVKLESDVFNVAGSNRSPRFISPMPAHNTHVPIIFGSTTQVTTLNVTDDNLNHIHLALDVDPAVADDLSINTYTCPWDTEVLCVGPGNPATIFQAQYQYQTWGAVIDFVPQGASGCIQPLENSQFGYGTPVEMTPSCPLTARQYPGPRSSVPLCFEPTDEFEVNTRPMYTRGDERCVDVEVLASSAPVVTSPFHWDAARAQLSGIAPDAIDAQGAVPDMGGQQQFTIGTGCLLEFEIAAFDSRQETHLEMRPWRTTVTSLYSQVTLDDPLPLGAELGVTQGTNPASATFRFQPRRGMEGRKYTICFVVRATVEAGCTQDFFTAPYHGHPGQFCVEVHVERCRVCGRPGDSLASLAKEYGTTVNQIWGGNDMSQAQHLDVGQTVYIGPTYEVGNDETLQNLAQKLSNSPETLLALNPDLEERRQALLGGEALVSSRVRYDPGEAPWTNQSGTIMPESQSLCFVPPICTYEAIAEPADPSMASFQCDVCEEGREYCTAPRCVEGNGPGPWLEANCTKFVGMRCQRCTACQAEEVGTSGDITVPGFYRATGCDGGLVGGSCVDCTADATCLPCTICKASEVEERPCTPLQDRVCRRAGAPGSSFIPE